MGNLTESQLHILLHSLGLTKAEEIYRNHFVAGPGHSDYDDCMVLVEIGAMIRRQGSELTGGDNVFYVTAKGKAIAESGRPRLTRSQRNYREWLNDDSSISFGEWIKRRHAKLHDRGPS